MDHHVGERCFHGVRKSTSEGGEGLVWHSKVELAQFTLEIENELTILIAGHCACKVFARPHQSRKVGDPVKGPREEQVGSVYRLGQKWSGQGWVTSCEVESTEVVI